jgi:hypothetical protein
MNIVLIEIGTDNISSFVTNMFFLKKEIFFPVYIGKCLYSDILYWLIILYDSSISLFDVIENMILIFEFLILDIVFRNISNWG